MSNSTGQIASNYSLVTVKGLIYCQILICLCMYIGLIFASNCVHTLSTNFLVTYYSQSEIYAKY